VSIMHIIIDVDAGDCYDYSKEGKLYFYLILFIML